MSGGPVFASGGDYFRPERRRTRVVRVGACEIGGDNPIRIQSMTNTDTMDTAGTVAQTIRLAEAGCEIVRVTAPSIRDAENLRAIRKSLADAGVSIPLVADIHFTPNAAMIAAEVVEKVRINPGNYADKKKFEVREYDDREYAAEIDRVRDRFRPLVRRCRENGVAMRIGTNHGSLSDRIMNRFGDTAEGMVESALEFLDVCEDENYYDLVFSMKASNTQVAIQAYRLLAARLEARAPGRPSYPFHVGVTEAGDAEDGRIKSAIGIGGLLEDGLGDTIRVSLTEDPVREVPVARGIAARAEAVRAARGAATESTSTSTSTSTPTSTPTSIRVRSAPMANYFEPKRRETDVLRCGALALGGEEPVRVELHVPGALAQPVKAAAELAMDLSGLRDVACESLLVDVPEDQLGVAAAYRAFVDELASLGVDLPVSLRLGEDATSQFLEADEGAEWKGVAPARWVLRGTPSSLQVAAARPTNALIDWELKASQAALPLCVAKLLEGSAPISAVGLTERATLHDYRVLVAALEDAGGARWPIVLRQSMPAAAEGDSKVPSGLRVGGVPEAALLDASVRLGGLLCDGIGDLVSIRSEVGASEAIDVTYRILQGARQRTTRTEYISCPSCGRTLFDLEEITARIKARTDHLKGVKIAIMGCIVNGPGEMADADFGYVGSGVGQVTLYVGREVVARAVPEAEATDRLIDLIRDHGQWVDEPA